MEYGNTRMKEQVVIQLNAQYLLYHRLDAVLTSEEVFQFSSIWHPEFAMKAYKSYQIPKNSTSSIVRETNNLKTIILFH